MVAGGDEDLLAGDAVAAVGLPLPADLVGGRDDVLAFRLSRVRNVYAISTLNYSDRLPPMTTSVPGLHIVNSAQIVNASLAVNESVALAEQAVPRLLA